MKQELPRGRKTVCKGDNTDSRNQLRVKVDLTLFSRAQPTVYKLLSIVSTGLDVS